MYTILHDILTKTVSMRFKSQIHHWNVTGKNFGQFHDFFQEIYEELNEAIDEIGEQIRIETEDAVYEDNVTFNFSGMITASQKERLESLNRMNESIIELTKQGVNQAEDGSSIEDFLIERQRAHKMHGYKIKSYLRTWEQK